MAGALRLFNKMPMPMPTVDNPDYAVFMENVIFEGRCEASHVGGHAQAFDPDTTKARTATTTMKTLNSPAMMKMRTTMELLA